MDHFHGITAEIISNGQVLNFYDDPDAAEIEGSHARYHYVEAVAGSTFVVKVYLTPQSKFYPMEAENAVRVRLQIDGHDNLVTNQYTRESLQERFSRGKTETFAFSGPRYFCKDTEQWMRSEYSFRNLVLKEIPDFGLSVKQAQDLGTIQIAVQRVRREKYQMAYVRRGAPITTIDEVPEKALKGRPIETTVRLANARPTSKPPVLNDRFIDIGGAAGEPMVFNIFYRSRRALQMLGCILRSPSPSINISDDETAESIVKPESNPSTTNSSINQSHVSVTSGAGSADQMLRQIQVLTARITDLERANIKPEAATTGTLVKSEGVGVKREREEDEGQQDSRQRRRTAVKIEHIDLTDD